mgnify:CR=1 FL=1
MGKTTYKLEEYKQQTRCYEKKYFIREMVMNFKVRKLT